MMIPVRQHRQWCSVSFSISKHIRRSMFSVRAIIGRWRNWKKQKDGNSMESQRTNEELKAFLSLKAEHVSDLPHFGPSKDMTLGFWCIAKVWNLACNSEKRVTAFF